MDWRTSREFFYWRLKRRLGENQIVKAILKIEPSINYESAMNYLQQWFNEDNNNQVRLIVCFSLVDTNLSNFLQNSEWTTDKIVAEWLDQCQKSSSINDRIKILQKQKARQDIQRFVSILSEKNSFIILFLDCWKFIQTFYHK